MTERKMLIIVPTRSRPQNVAKVAEAWEETGAFEDGTELLFAIDQDDPRYGDYIPAILNAQLGQPRVDWYEIERHLPMVHKLNRVASVMAHQVRHFAIGFAGDDHLPRTAGWAARYFEALAEMKTGIVSCPDGYRRDDLPTQWAMTADIVRRLGRMVPAPVEHLYCDNAVRDLAKAADCWRYLDDVLIEHVHPAAKKTDWDDQYLAVNRKAQFATDRAAYGKWWDGSECGEPNTPCLECCVERLRKLYGGSTAPYSSEAEEGR